MLGKNKHFKSIKAIIHMPMLQFLRNNSVTINRWFIKFTNEYNKIKSQELFKTHTYFKVLNKP